METKKEEDYSRKFSFIDADNNKVDVKLEVKQKDDGRKTFSMSGDYCGGCGQVFDDVKPANTHQKKLIAIWNKYHLNDMHAGTEEQEQALKDFKGDYEERCKFLAEKKLLEVKLKNGTLYKYGTGWLYNELPVQFVNELKNIIANIKKFEDERNANPLSDDEKAELASLLEDEKIQTLKENLELTDREILSILSRGNIYTVNGVDYWVLTESEAEDECREYLDKDMWIDAIKGNYTTESFEDWQEYVISNDGYGQILNHYDGSEDSENINGTTYYIIRC